MKWTRVNSTCIRLGAYRISKYTLGGMDYYEVYHGETLIGDARGGNEARKVADKHASRQEVES